MVQIPYIFTQLATELSIELTRDLYSFRMNSLYFVRTTRNGMWLKIGRYWFHSRRGTMPATGKLTNADKINSYPGRKDYSNKRKRK